MATLNTDRAAERLNCDPKIVEQLFRKGIIPAAKIGRSWVAREVDVDEYLAEQIRIQTEARRKGNPVEPTIELQIVEHDRLMDGRRRRKPLPRLPQLPG